MLQLEIEIIRAYECLFDKLNHPKGNMLYMHCSHLTAICLYALMLLKTMFNNLFHNKINAFKIQM